ncbi:kinase-like protein [Xylaria sp. FL1042]|nr:kinase-like protein [Xylaria sp. FL1042]
MAHQRPWRGMPDLYPDSQDILPVETLERYTAGGFHPVNLGDTFQDGRYTIRHKLGFGGFSTVWLAYDQDASQWVSIKVKTAASSTEDLEQDSEVSIMRQLESCYAKSAQSGPMPFVRLLDCFHHVGPNGTHNCLVMELLGPSLSNVLDCYEYRRQTFRPDTVLRTSCQLLDALAFFHQAGFAHGDIYNSNVGFTCSFIESEEDLFDVIGDPITSAYENTEIPWSPELPKHLVACTAWPGWYESPDECLRLIDLGVAFPVANTVTDIAQPMDVRSPETFFIGSFDYRHDLWRAGCVIYSLYYQKRPFISFWEGGYLFTRILVEKLGPIPDDWQSKWEEMREQSQTLLVDEHRPELIIETFEPRRNAIILSCEDEDGEYEKDEHSEHDYAALESLLWVLKGLFQYKPEKRLSPREVISHIRSKWTDYRRESRLEEPTLEELTLEEPSLEETS